MFSLRSCSHRSALVSLSLNLAGKFPFSPSVSFSFKPLFLFVRSSPSLRTMSTPRPSAFDVLMSNASKKKKNPSQSQPPKSQESSPRKRKSPVEISQTPNLNPTDNSQSKVSNPIENAAGEDQESAKNSTLDQIGDAHMENSVKNSSDGTLSSSPAEEARLPGSTKKLKESSLKQTGSKRADSNEGSVVAKNPRVSITPDESLAELKKKAANFNVKRAAYWGEGERVPFMFVVKALDAISKESGRIAITEIVCNMLRTVIETTPDDLLAVVYLLANRIASAHDGLELGIGDASIIKALAEACGTKEAHIKKQYKELGDLGLVAKASRSSQPLMRKPEALTVAKVFDTFRLIAQESGKDSQEKKKNHIKALLVAASDCEPQYLIRLLQTKLRIGLAEQTLLAALGHAAVYSEKHSSPPAKVDNPLEEAAKIVKQVYSVIPVYDKIVPALLSGGVWNLPKTCSFSPGIPVGPMLAKPTKGVSEIVEKFQDMEFTCEYKYDGERAQIHYMEDGSVEIYSRNAERNTGKFPDVVAAITRLKKPSVTSFVLDCELVAYDREKQKIQPFQVLSTRARKNVLMNEIKVNVCIFAFDILYLNGQQLLQEQLNVRREHLYNSFQEEHGFLQFATAITSNDLEEIQKFLDDAVNSSSEGLIIKTLKKDATYEPSKRSHNWLKLKKDYMDSIGDSLDLVPIAAFHGRGKRTGVYGAFLLACYDSDKEEFQSICKIGTGFSEAMLEERSSSLRSKVIPKPKSYYRYSDTISPDVWFEPTEVWEVKAADLTISPVHRAAVGIVDPDKGISLRFPRLLRVREDKNPEEASSSDMVADMYKAQKHNQKDNKDENDDD
ncbi:DNA ligase 1 [Sesamum alatum]|uniref:DNA ligase n=1 Tax=Sesamum alatum TaxID=300844 RepID=A0AAE1Z2T7_9LAMI|nr:DNA ligase 1 [Sesamum alatum]